MDIYTRSLRIVLAVVAWFNLLSAVLGMLGLTIGFLPIPVEWLDGSAFTSYLWPGVILGVVVGGVQVLALVAQYGRWRLAAGLHAAAGLVMIGWVFIEVAMLPGFVLLQGIYFATGVLQTVLAVLLLGAWPRPFLGRDRPVDSGS